MIMFLLTAPFKIVWGILKIVGTIYIAFVKFVVAVAFLYSS